MADRKYKVKIVVETEISLPDDWDDGKVADAAWKDLGATHDNRLPPGATYRVDRSETLDEAARRGFGE
jgi:hypothetical protein